jgi:hypothetical protein
MAALGHPLVPHGCAPWTIVSEKAPFDKYFQQYRMAAVALPLTGQRELFLGAFSRDIVACASWVS